jgi:hypothetical protein
MDVLTLKRLRQGDVKFLSYLARLCLKKKKRLSVKISSQLLTPSGSNR